MEKLRKYEALGARFTPTAMLRQLAQEKRGFYRE